MLTNLSTTLASMNTFGAWLEKELRRRDLSPSEFARQLGVNPSMVSRWLSGTKPDTKSVDMLSDALGLDIDFLLTLTGHRPNIEDRDPDDIAEVFSATIRWLDWESDPTRREIVSRVLETYVRQDRERRSGRGRVAS